MYRFPESFWPCQIQQADTSVAAAGWHSAGGFAFGLYGPRYVLIRSDDAGSTWSGPLDAGLPMGPGSNSYRSIPSIDSRPMVQRILAPARSEPLTVPVIFDVPMRFR